MQQYYQFMFYPTDLQKDFFAMCGNCDRCGGKISCQRMLEIKPAVEKYFDTFLNSKSYKICPWGRESAVWIVVAFDKSAAAMIKLHYPMITCQEISATRYHTMYTENTYTKYRHNDGIFFTLILLILIGAIIIW